MQQQKRLTRLNQMALVAFLIGVCAFIYDVSTDRPYGHVTKSMSAPDEAAQPSRAAHAPAPSRAALIAD